MYTVFVTLDVHSDKIDDFVEAITSNAEASLRVVDGTHENTFARPITLSSITGEQP
jgi:hypothetical protein